MSEQFCLLAVHAHPDDESSKGAGTVARYHAEGVHTVLVTCTGGEEGEILNPALDRDDIRADLGNVRRRELEEAVEVIGYDELIFLGYRDSGMADSPANSDPRSFAQAPLDEAVGRLVEIIRRTRPQVIITYGEDLRGYRHPDHVKVHEISLQAFDQAGDPNAYPDCGEPFTPSKLYYTVWARAKAMKRHEKFLELGMESPYEARRDRGVFEEFPEESPLTVIDISPFAHVRFAALRAHGTQIDPNSAFWFGLPEEVEHEIYSTDEFTLAQNRVGPIEDEDDLFAGLREDANLLEQAQPNVQTITKGSTMPKWLSQEWLDESLRLAKDQPERPDASARLQYHITGGPNGDIEYFWVVRDGHLLENTLGKLADAEVTLTETYDDAMRMQKGELDPTAAFMQGMIKVDGDVAKLMALLPITMSPEFAEFQSAVLEMTEF